MRAYETEDRVFQRRKKPMEMGEAREIAGRLFDLFSLPPIKVERTRGFSQAYSWFYPPNAKRGAVIRLTQEAPDWVLCHEVAHYAAYMAGAKKNKLGGHSWPWATCYVHAVAAVISTRYAERLAKAFVEAKVLRPEDLEWMYNKSPEQALMA